MGCIRGERCREAHSRALGAMPRPARRPRALSLPFSSAIFHTLDCDRNVSTNNAFSVYGLRLSQLPVCARGRPRLVAADRQAANACTERTRTVLDNSSMAKSWWYRVLSVAHATLARTPIAYAPMKVGYLWPPSDTRLFTRACNTVPCRVGVANDNSTCTPSPVPRNVFKRPSNVC